MPDPTFGELESFGTLSLMTSANPVNDNVTIPELLAIIIKNQTKILGLLGNWTVSGTTMTTYVGNSTLASYTLTKDSGDNIVGIQEN